MKKIFFLILIFTSCNVSDRKYKDKTSSKNDIDFYELVEVHFKDDASSGNISIPDFLVKSSLVNENNIFNYSYFDHKSGYIVSIDYLESRNTQKLSDKQYLDITNEWFEKDFNGDLSEIERILSPQMKNVRVVKFESNLIINDKHFLERVSYFQDKSFEGTIWQDVNCTNFHFVTLHNKRKYSFNINYYGDDKSVSELIAIFNTIGGSISFD